MYSCDFPQEQFSFTASYVSLAMNLGGKVALAVKLPGTTTKENPPSQRESSSGRAIASSRHLDCVCEQR